MQVVAIGSAHIAEKPGVLVEITETKTQAGPFVFEPAVPAPITAAVAGSRSRMMAWWLTGIGILGGLLILWLTLVVLIWLAARKHHEATTPGDALRLLPDTIRLLRRLAVDPNVPRGVRVWLIVLVAYLLSPIDLIPDVIPLLGYADDAIVVAVALRFVTRHAGSAALDKHWPGTPQGLRALRALAGLPG